MNLKKITISILIILLLAKFFGRYKSWKILSSGDSITFSPDSQMIAYATGETIRQDVSLYDNYSGSSTVEIRKVKNGRIIKTFDFFSASSIAFNSDNSLIAVAGYGGKIKIWRIKDGQLIQTFKQAEHDEDITKKLVFTADSKTLISSTISHSDSQYSNSNISVWDLEQGINVKSIYQPFTCAAISSDGQLFALGGNKSIITIHRTEDNVPIQYLDDFQETNPHFCDKLIFSQDNKLIVSDTSLYASKDDVFVHRVRDGKLLHKITWSDENHTSTDINLSPDNKFIAMSYRVRDADGSMFLFPTYDFPIGLFGHIDFWHINDSDYRFNLPVATIRAHWLRINKIAFSPDGKWLASMSDSKDNNRVRLWRMPPYSGWWWFLGFIALVVLVFRLRNELQEWINR